MNRRGRAGEVVNLIHLNIERERHVVAEQLEIRIVQEMNNILFAACEVIVQTDHIIAFSQQPLAKVRAEKARSTGDQYPFFPLHRFHGVNKKDGG